MVVGYDSARTDANESASGHSSVSERCRSNDDGRWPRPRSVAAAGRPRSVDNGRTVRDDRRPCASAHSRSRARQRGRTKRPVRPRLV